MDPTLETATFLDDRPKEGHWTSLVRLEYFISTPNLRAVFTSGFQSLKRMGERDLTRFSLGGETFTVFPMKNGLIRNVISTSKCAAGTGEFIVQQLQRMGLSIEEGIEAGKKGKFTPLATRCSVHCKSDATHKLNKGECKPKDVSKTLIYDLARKVSEMIESAQWPTNLIVLSGGVSLNKVLIENLQNFLKFRDKSHARKSLF